MKPAVIRGVIAFGALLVLGAVNLTIKGKEDIKAHGETIYLQLAPADPRSLMQGDYMALRFAITSEFDPAHYLDRRVPLTLNSQRVAHVTAADAAAPDLHLRYRVRNGQLWLGTNAFFFAEGEASRYMLARYGEFRVDRKSSEAVLVGLRDEHFQPLQRTPQ